MRGLVGAADVIVENGVAGVVPIPFQLSRSAPPSRRTFANRAAGGFDFPDASLIHPASELKTGDTLTWIGGVQLRRWSVNRLLLGCRSVN